MKELLGVLAVTIVFAMCIVVAFAGFAVGFKLADLIFSL